MEPAALRAAAGPVALAALAAVAGHAAPGDVAGADDPAGVERYPGSRIVAHAPSAPVRGYEFVTGRVDRSSRNARFDESVRVAADLARTTYQAPAGTRLDDVVEHYQAVVQGLDASVAFDCRGRDCGRSTVWANDVFGVKELVAPDRQQFYLAAATGPRLLAIYVVQRGNRRVYAHVDVAHTRASADGDLAGRLSRQGFVVLGGAAPDAAGALDAADLQALDGVAERLGGLAGRALYVVCHLGGVADAQAAMERSDACARTAAAHLQAAGVDAQGFGGGALLPREDAPADRLELVLPR